MDFQNVQKLINKMIPIFILIEKIIKSIYLESEGTGDSEDEGDGENAGESEGEQGISR